MKDKYGANERSQKLKYHIQTSGRSLHAQEIQFNDIRTTLQALIAIYDNCNSLHTNAFDEAITTPTEDSVRRAMAIQLIINREWGLAKNENPSQGAFIIDELTELVEEAVLLEFERIAERGGVLGAMETGYQRGRIQDESMHYEMLKHTGELPIIGVNTFRNPHGDTGAWTSWNWPAPPTKKSRTSSSACDDFHPATPPNRRPCCKRLQQAVIDNLNVFEVLMDAVRVCSLGQITNALFEVGGQYRRNMSAGDFGPLLHHGPAARDDFIGKLPRYPEKRRDGAREIEVQRVVGLADVELQAVRPGHGVHVVGLGQAPALARHEKKAVIAQVIVGVGNQHVEHNARPKLTQVGVGLRAVLYQYPGNLQIARTC
jgi:hypothetical protein